MLLRPPPHGPPPFLSLVPPVMGREVEAAGAAWRRSRYRSPGRHCVGPAVPYAGRPSRLTPPRKSELRRQRIHVMLPRHTRETPFPGAHCLRGRGARLLRRSRTCFAPSPNWPGGPRALFAFPCTQESPISPKRPKNRGG
jgi:hypothetical protein